MNSFKILSVTALLALFCGATSFAETLTVDAGGPVAAGTNGVPVNIIINEGQNTAGASFTVTYDPAKLVYRGVTSLFFATFAQQTISPPSVTIDSQEYTQGLVANPSSGMVMLAAAQSANGASGQQTLFTLSFDVLSGVTGTANIGITASTITNAAAGYPTATQLPLLVGISGTTYPTVPVTTITPDTLTINSVITDTDGDGIDDTWENTHFDNLTTANATSDFDQDGYTDKQEYLNGVSYDPKVKNVAGGPGYNALTDKGWIMLHGTSAENIVAFRDGIAADFGANGLWYFDGTVWTQINTVSPQLMLQANIDADADMELVVSFPGVGLFVWDDTWTLINTIEPEAMIAFDNKIVLDFGTNGLYAYNSADGYNQMTPGNSNKLAVADVDSDGIVELAASFTSGLYIWDGGWTQINVFEPENIIAFGNKIALDFGTYGLYTYNSAEGYIQLTPANPVHLTAADVDSDGNTELAVSFSGSGLYIWDNSWAQITPAEPEDMIVLGKALAIDFGSSGLYFFTMNTGFTMNSDQNPSLMVANQNSLYCQFNAGLYSFSQKYQIGNSLLTGYSNGLYTYDNTSSWQQLHSSQSTMAIPVDFDNDGISEIAAVFPGAGFYIWNGVNWTEILPVTPENMIVFGNKLAIDFGSDGLYTYSNSEGFIQLTPADPARLATADVDNDGNAELAVSFTGVGLYIWDGGWTQIVTITPEDMIAFGNKLAVDFGSAGLFTYSNSENFIQLTPADPALLATADVDNDGNAELAVSLTGVGLYIWDGGWTQIVTITPENMIVFGNKLAIDFGSVGLFTYSNSEAFIQLTPADPALLATADVDNDGNAELAVSFTGAGLFIWDGGWSQINDTSPDFMTALFK